MTHSMDKWIQVASAQHYDPIQYLSPSRMASIGYQFRLMDHHFHHASVLEIGPGGGLTTAILRQIGHAVTTLDVDARLKPDRIGSITEMPCETGEFDSLLCCQVLEHLPWDMVETALREMHRVVRLGGVISVPTLQPTWLVMKYDAKSHGTRRLRLRHRLNKPMRIRDGQHHWELEANVRTKSFRDRLHSAGFSITKELQPVENMYHQFFVLEKRSAHES